MKRVDHHAKIRKALRGLIKALDAGMRDKTMDVHKDALGYRKEYLASWLENIRGTK
jgi:hypothetical protein